MDQCLKANVKVHKYPFSSSAKLATEVQSVSLVGSVKVTMILQTLVGQVIIHNVPCEVTDAAMDEVLLGNDVLKHLGIDVSGLLAEMGDREVNMDPLGDEMYQEFIDFGETNEAEIRAGIDKMVSEALEAGLPAEKGEDWSSLLHKFADVWRIKLGKDPPARVDPMYVNYNREKKPWRHKNRRYSLVHRQFMKYYTDRLVEHGFVYENRNARYVSPAYIVPRVPNPVKIETDFRFTVDAREPNNLSDVGQWPMPIMEQVQEHLAGARYFAAIDLKDGYWQCPVHEDCQELFSFATDQAVFTPNRVIHGATGAVLYFQSVMQKSFEDMLYVTLIIWMDDFLLYARTVDELYAAIHKFLLRCRQIGVKLAVKKCKIFTTVVQWCGKELSASGIKNDSSRLQGLRDLPAPITAADLMKFLYAVNWIRTTIPDYARIAQHLQQKLDEVLKGKGRTKKKAQTVILEWSVEDQQCFEAIKHAVMSSVEQAHPDHAKEFILMTDACDKGWGVVLFQASSFDSSKALADQDLEPLYFLSGTFKGSSLHWAINEKEAYPIIEGVKRLRHLLLRPKGFKLLCDHRNLVFLFNEQVGQRLPTRSKLLRWALELQSYRYVIEHLEGERNLWADLLSRWVQPVGFKAIKAGSKIRKGQRSNRISVVYPRVHPLNDLQWPSTAHIREIQAAVSSPFGVHFREEVELFVNENNKIWIPEEAEELKRTLMVIAHNGASGHRGVQSTKLRLQRKFWWKKMQQEVQVFVKECILCRLSKGKPTIRRPWGLHGEITRRNQVLHLDFLFIGESNTGMWYILVLKDGLSHYLELVVCSEASSAIAVVALMDWVKRFGIPEAIFTDQGPHFRSEFLKEFIHRMGMGQSFSTPYCAWSNGAAERPNQEILALLRIMLPEFNLSHEQWTLVVQLIQFALNQAIVVSLAERAPVEVFTGLPISDPLNFAINQETRQLLSSQWSQKDIGEHCRALHEALMNMTIEAREVTQKLQQINRSKDNLHLFPFEIGDYVLWSRVDRKGPSGKLYATWTGPHQIVDSKSSHVFFLKHLVKGHVFPAHVSRMDFFSDEKLQITEDLCNLVSKQGEELDISRIDDLRWNGGQKQFEFLVFWDGFGAAEATWEPLQSLFPQVPVLVLQFLKGFQDKPLVRKLWNKHKALIEAWATKKVIDLSPFPWNKF